jgi:hypothetical protein
VECEARAGAGVAGDCHVDVARVVGREAPDRGGGVVAEQRAGAGGEDGCRLAPMLGLDRSYLVDAAKSRREPSPGDAMGDGTAPQPGCGQLRERDHAVLLRGHAGDRPVAAMRFDHLDAPECAGRANRMTVMRFDHLPGRRIARWSNRMTVMRFDHLLGRRTARWAFRMR